jgi:hypothetical protein
MSEKSTRLEDLSDELFLDIFSFIRPKDLLQGWCNLNYHINAILRSVPISIEIKNNDDFNDSLPSLQYFCSQIIYLKDDRFLPDTQIDIRSLINIRSLHLIQCSNEQYKHIHPDNHPRLTRFFSLSVPWSFYERILFGQTRFSRLMSIGYPRGASILLLNVSHSVNTTIRHLHLHSASNEMVCKFLEYLPNITSLTIDYFYSNSSSSTTLFTNSYVRHLTILHILSSQSHFEQLLCSLGFANLTYLRVAFGTCDFEQLANLFIKLSCLRQFYLRVDTYPADLDLTSIRLMNPWFLSLNYEYIIDKSKSKRILSINTTSKQLD